MFVSRTHVRADLRQKLKGPRTMRRTFDERQLAKGPRTRAGRRSRKKLLALGLLIK